MAVVTDESIEEFTNINGFSLYGETQSSFTINNTSIPWLRIKKEPNKLPVAYLTSRVFYWKKEEKSGNKYIFYSHVEQEYKENVNDASTIKPSNTYLNGRMSGFPLIRPSIDIDNSNWILSKSINTSGNKIFETNFEYTQINWNVYRSRFISPSVGRTIVKIPRSTSGLGGTLTINNALPGSTTSQYYKEQGFCFPPPIKQLNQEDRNIIVIDLQNIKPINPSIIGSNNWNKYPLKYLILRITNWEENYIETDETKEFKSGGRVLPGFNARLIKCNYTYTCDIINPYDIYTLQDTKMSINQSQSFCDMNLNFFLINTIPVNFGGNNVYRAPWWVKKWNAVSDGQTINSDVLDFIEGNFDISISINPKYEDSPISIYETQNGKISLCLWNDISNNNIEIVGRDYSYSEDYPRLGGYNGWTVGDQFQLSSYPDVNININYLNETVLNNNYGWINTITLKSNNVNNTFQEAEYSMTNPLWYSLNSPRHTVVHMIGQNNQVLTYKYKWAVNYTKKPIKSDGSFEYHYTNEGHYTDSFGYTKNKKTIDMGRKTYLPYYCQKDPNGNIINENTITTFDGLDVNQPTGIEQYADGGNTLSEWYTNQENENKLTEWENSHLAPVVFKLLIPPLNSNNAKTDSRVTLKYTFGKNNNSVTTFYRDSDLSGVYDPIGNTNQYAVREEESISLIWNTNIVDYKKFKLLDIASGFKNNAVFMEINNDNKLKNYFSNLSDNENIDYDLSTNVVQVYLISNDYTVDISDPNFKKEEALKKLLILATTDSQYYTVKITPENFIPYRYYNGEIGNIPFKDNSGNYSFNPLDTFSAQTFYFNPSKYTTIQDNNGYINGNNTNAKIILPTTQNLFDSNGLIVTGGEDISFNLVYSEDILSQGTNPVILNRFKSSTVSNPSLTIQPFPTRKKIVNFSIPYISDIRPIPTTTDLNQYILQDYWKWIPSVCRTFNINDASDIVNQTYSYKYYDVHNQISGFIQPVDVTLNVGSILINTRYNESAYIIKPFPCSDNNCNYNSNPPVLNIVGGLDVTPSINDVPLTTFLYLDPTPPNASGILNQQETPWEGQTIVQNGGGDAYVQISPPINTTPFVWGENADESGWNSGSFIELFKAKEKYPSLTTRQDRLRWNQLYNLRIRGVNVAFTDNSPIWYNNPNYLGIPVAPVEGVKVNCVELWPAILKNPQDVVNNSSNLVTLVWDSYFFDPETQGDICWTITRKNIATGENITLLDDSTITPTNNEYVFRDSDVKVYDKLFYTVSGIFKWRPDESSDYLTLSVEGFSTNTIFVCKNNKFQYGRYNTTSTNLKLYRPLLIRQPGGQCDNNDNCVGGVCRGLVNGKMQSLYVPNSKIQSSNNIYANTSNQLTQKQIYVLLAKANYRPFR